PYTTLFRSHRVRENRVRDGRRSRQRWLRPQEDRQRRVRVVALQGHLNSLVVAEDAGEVHHARTLIGEAESPAHDAVTFLRAEEQTSEPATSARNLPREAGARPEVVAVDVVGVRPGGILTD